MAFPGSQRALITGRFGFTGRHLAQFLELRGWEVLGLDPSEASNPDATPAIDINDTGSIVQRLMEVRPTHIVHLAAHSHVVGDPLAFFRVNLLGTESLMEAIASSGIQPAKVLVASSANVYGNAVRTPITEEEPLRPMNHYALSKAAMELLVHKWFERLPIIVTRPFNYTGVGQSPSFLIPKIVAAFHRRDAVLRLGNTGIARDFSDVAFVCEAYARLLKSTAHSTVVNICSGRSTSVNQILALLTDITGHRPYIEVDPALVRKDEVMELRGDSAHLQALVGPLAPVPMRDILAGMVAPAAR
jgi:nucleoside-diphosphate-sugar epimerase